MSGYDVECFMVDGRMVCNEGISKESTIKG